MLSTAISQVRGIATITFPMDVQQQGLGLALQALAARTTAAGPVIVTFQATGTAPENLDPATATQLYRIAQEALSNALRHGKPEHVTLTLGCDGGDMVLSISDDGRGIPGPEGCHAGVGIRAMRYRAALIRATLAIEALPRGGTRVEARIRRTRPLADDAAAR